MSNYTVDQRAKAAAMATREGKLFRSLQVRARLRSLQLFSNLGTNSSVRNDELALMEFLVTVKNRHDWVRVMMLSVSARSRTDRRRGGER